MTDSPSAFAAATAITPTGVSSYTAVVDPVWSIAGVANGGYSMAILTRAALATSGMPHPLAISGHYLRPPLMGRAEVTVELLKTGRRTSSVRCSLIQEDKIRLDALITTGTLPEIGAHDDGGWAGRPAPSMPPPDECTTNDRGPFQVALLAVVEERLDPATLPFGPSDDGSIGLAPTGTPLIRGWVRLADGAEPDALFLPLAADAMPPTVFNLGRFGWAPTVELTVLLRAQPAPGWLLCEASTTLFHDGWFDEECTIWDSTGQLVAQSRQLAIAAAP